MSYWTCMYTLIISFLVANTLILSNPEIEYELALNEEILHSVCPCPFKPIHIPKHIQIFIRK